MPTLDELVGALPDDSERPPQGELEALLEELSGKKPPRGRFRRMWSTGDMSARIAIAYFGYWVRSSFASPGEKARLHNEAQLKAAYHLLAKMGYMRGILMKLGQVLAMYPDVVPAAWAGVFSTFHFDAPRMHFSLMREVLEGELQADVEELFASIETEAVAAASLGQVHRARLHSGDDVAVKIQYPAIGRAVRADFSNFNTLVWSLRLTENGDNLRAQFDEVREMLIQETDYTVEAALQERAAAALADIDGVIVPGVVAELSRNRVLTSDFVEGVHLEAFLQTGPSQAERDEYGRKILLSYTRLLYRDRLCYSDLNPGNLIFMGDGRLGLIDFGACKPLDDDDWQYVLLMERAFRDGGAVLEQALAVSADLDEKDTSDEEWISLLSDMCEWFWEPRRCDGPFDFGDSDYLRRGLQLQTVAIRTRRTRSRPLNVWLTRSFFGARSLLWRLGARVDAASIHERALDGVL